VKAAFGTPPDGVAMSRRAFDYPFRRTGMRMKVMVCAIAAFAAVGISSNAQAQVFSPSYLAPRVANELGIYVSDSPGDVTAEGSLRANFSGTMLGLRAGIADMDDAQLTIGGELLHPLTVTNAPLDFAVTGAAQALIGDVKLAGFSLGLDIGHTFVSPGLTVSPYIHPRIALSGGYGDEGEMDADLLADLGVNVDLAPNLSLRLGIGLTGPVSNWGFGAAWRR
jgi:hypothetical protein